MATYLLVNSLFLLTVLALFRVRLKNPTRAHWVTLLALLIMTAVFDSLIVGLDIVDYDQSKILGIYIGQAPVEDFFYTLAAVMIVPQLWKLFGEKRVG